MNTYVRIGLSLVLLCGGFVGTAFASSDRELLLSAPIEQLDRSADTVTVLGQKFHAQAGQLSVGEVVHVYGVLAKDGSIGDTLVQGTDAYAANGDAVFVKGVVTNIDTLLGRAEVNGMTIDYTPQLANAGFVAPSIGDVIAVAASQPLSKGVLMAYAAGMDAYAVGTTTADSISVASTGLNNTGALPGSASGHTGVAGMNGGGSAAGMNGGGAAAKGMNGGGFAAGMNGGGSAAGMNGGGAAAKGMNGGGFAAGMNGGGSAAGMNGGGAAAKGMNGGGFRTAGMNGGGK
jgi:hypothetical protein